jgi:hypothetical protein
MKAASLSEIRKQLNTLDSGTVGQLCLRLARYRKENKELLTYLLFEADDEQAYVFEIKQEVDDLFATLPKGNAYLLKKSIRKILRVINKYIRYSSIPATELEVRVYFCQKMRAVIPLYPGTVLSNLYQQQISKITSVWTKLPEDLQFDYERDIRSISEI